MECCRLRCLHGTNSDDLFSLRWGQRTLQPFGGHDVVPTTVSVAIGNWKSKIGNRSAGV